MAPVIMRMAVVLPAPLGPSNTVMLPCGTMIVRLRRAGTPAKRFHTLRMATMSTASDGVAATAPAESSREAIEVIVASSAGTPRYLREPRVGSTPPAGSMTTLVRVFVLGIDPGLSRCGYGVIERRGRRPIAVAAGVIVTDRQRPLAERLAHLQREVRSLIIEHRPAVVAIERVLFQTNVRTAMSVGQASGVVLAEAANAGCQVAEYSPNEVKETVTSRSTRPMRLRSRSVISRAYAVAAGYA
ncbi:MAG: crossover junction endodeoxyribonuclease RuvC [Actinobacteria bacterium]|nr:MAG: crossover junction endodeoxyribonuclease RuvC [Actinomycetota bacterium]